MRGHRSLHTKMRIKKNSNGNQYLLTRESQWVRNFTKTLVPYQDINNTIAPEDYFVFLKNEVQNGMRRYTWIDSEKIYHPRIIIVSDGYEFSKRHKLLASLPKDVAIIGVNRSLAKWELASRSMNYYVVNNPYGECMKYLPKGTRTLPKCIASARTNYEFLENYRGTKYRYYPVNESKYATLGDKEIMWQIDDYRNPICAAIGLAYRFGVEQLLLLCCDNVFKEERPGAKMLENGLWIYPQQEVATGIIDGNLYWLKQQQHAEVFVKNCSDGLLLDNATYINEEKIDTFWE